MKKSGSMTLFALACALASGCSTTQDPLRYATAGNHKLADSQEIVCQTRAPTGSHLKEKVCMTRDEWDAERMRAQDAIRMNVKRSLSRLSTGRMN